MNSGHSAWGVGEGICFVTGVVVGVRAYGLEAEREKER